MKNILFLISMLIVASAMSSCSKKEGVQGEQIPIVNVKTTAVRFGEIDSKLTFNGKTVYLKKNLVSAPISGYVRLISIKFGDHVKKGDLMFEIQTKENKALESSNSGNMGLIKVFAPSQGIVSMLNITENGAYVVEGASLCTVAENHDVLVQLNLPFEFNSLVKNGKICTLILGENTKFSGTIYQILPTVDDANQTQQVLIKPNYNKPLPENLNLEVEILKARHDKTCLIPRNALMTNETQTEFWVMKVVNNKLALKVLVQKGIENTNFVEITNSGLNANDLIISEGAYGLNDSSIVRIAK
jgi:multidrug efflux pump subunit AcrA (membrane-fusion protein)